MNVTEALDKLLQLYRFWRDIGAYILITALVAEFLIEALWSEHLSRSPWKRTRISSWRLRQLLRPFSRLTRKRAMIFAALIVALGVGIETLWGKWADDIVDQIRQEQQGQIKGAEETANSSNQRATEASEHAAKLERGNIKLRNLWSTRPEFDVGESTKFDKLKEFPRTIIWAQGIPAEMPGEAGQTERNLSSWWYAGNIVNGVGRADWSSRLLHNSGDPHFSWIFGGVMVLTYPHDICGQRTWDAAEALTLYLRSVGIGNPVHWPMPSNSSFGREFVRFGFPKEGIFVTVGERQPESDVADFTGE